MALKVGLARAFTSYLSVSSSSLTLYPYIYSSKVELSFKMTDKVFVAILRNGNSCSRGVYEFVESTNLVDIYSTRNELNYLSLLFQSIASISIVIKVFFFLNIKKFLFKYSSHPTSILYFNFRISFHRIQSHSPLCYMQSSDIVFFEGKIGYK